MTGWALMVFRTLEGILWLPVSRTPVAMQLRTSTSSYAPLWSYFQGPAMAWGSDVDVLCHHRTDTSVLLPPASLNGERCTFPTQMGKAVALALKTASWSFSSSTAGLALARRAPSWTCGASG